MSSDIESMAYVGDKPWHGLGFKLPSGATPLEMLEAARLDWEVEKVPAYALVDGLMVDVSRAALVRTADNKVLDVVGDKWMPTQNIEAFNFFSEFVAAGNMTMETGGSLQGGQLVWALAKIKEQSFEVVKGDRVESYLLFVNPHKFGKSITIQYTPIRVVCANTLAISLNMRELSMINITHRRKFNPEEAKKVLQLAQFELHEHEKTAKYLASKRFDEANVKQYFASVFPVAVSGGQARKLVSKNAARAFEILDTQPGAAYARGSWWQAAQAVTYLTDHEIGRTVDARLTSAWFGANKALKISAFELALGYAQAA